MKSLITFVCVWFSCLLCLAQDGEELKKNYGVNYSKLPQFNLLLTFNQPKYTPGDTVWFNAYFLKEDQTKLKGKYLFEFNLVDHLGKTRHHFQFLILDGQGNNQFVIPDDWDEGIYLATVYNNYSRNFEHDYLFQKELIVVKNSEVVSSNSIRVEVEGGNLIESVPAKLNLLISDPQPDTIMLLTEKGRVVDKFWKNEAGMQIINFVPKLNTSYYIGSQSNSQIHVKLPTVIQSGANIHIINADEDKVWLGIDYSLANEVKYYVALVQSEKILFLEPYNLKGKNSIQLEFTRQSLPNGSILCQVLNDHWIIASTQVLYNERSKVNLDISLEPVETEGRAHVNFYLHDEDGKAVDGEFSISVINKSLFNNAVANNYDYEQYSARFFTLRPLINYFSNRPLIANYPLFGSVERSGRARYKNSGSYLETGTQLLIYLQKSKYYLHTTIGKNGWVRFALPDLYQQDEIYYTAFDHLHNREIRLFDITWDSTNITLPKAPPGINLNRIDPYAGYSDKVHRINQSYSIFKYDSAFDINDYSRPESEFARLIKKPDVTIKPKDYISFPTMSEFIQEVVKAMYYRKRKGDDRVRVYLEETVRTSSDPVYIIDDIATRNSSYFLSLLPSDINSIEILNSRVKLKPLGLLGRNGVVIVNTKFGNARAESLNLANVLTGISQEKRFKIPTHVSPQFRSTIYWNPSIQTDASGKAKVEFPFTDDSAEYQIVVQGITSDGRIFSARSGITPIVKTLE